VIVLDSGAVSYLAQRAPRALQLLKLLRRQDSPPVVPSIVLVESVTGDSRDANANRLLKTCSVLDELSEVTARRAAYLRHRAQRGSAVDATVVAIAEPGGAVLTSDMRDVNALASHAEGVTVVAV